MVFLLDRSLHAVVHFALSSLGELGLCVFFCVSLSSVFFSIPCPVPIDHFSLGLRKDLQPSTTPHMTDF